MKTPAEKCAERIKAECLYVGVGCEPDIHVDWAAAIIQSEYAPIEQRFTVPIVCMCGSTRFKQTWIAEYGRLTDEGFIVLSVGRFMTPQQQFADAKHKQFLDHLHKRKIDLCDWVWVLDVGGYIGDSTKSEIAYAEQLQRPIKYLSKELPDYKEPTDPYALTIQAAREAIQDALHDLEGTVYDSSTRAKRIIQLRTALKGL